MLDLLTSVDFFSSDAWLKGLHIQVPLLGFQSMLVLPLGAGHGLVGIPSRLAVICLGHNKDAQINREECWHAPVPKIQSLSSYPGRFFEIFVAFRCLEDWSWDTWDDPC